MKSAGLRFSLYLLVELGNFSNESDIQFSIQSCYNHPTHRTKSYYWYGYNAYGLITIPKWSKQYE